MNTDRWGQREVEEPGNAVGGQRFHAPRSNAPRSNAPRVYKRAGVLALVVLSIAAYGRVRAQATAGSGSWAPALALGKAPVLQSGAVGPVTLRAGGTDQTPFTVTFPTPYRSAPRVVLTVVGDAQTPVDARLTAPATATGFSGMLTVQYFRKTNASTVQVNWMAIGE